MAIIEKKYHYIYKITCIKTNRYYIGMHSTDDLKDGYMGGGIRIKNSIKVHGKNNHKKEILEFLNSRKELAERESEIVNPDCLKDPLCLNLCTGGSYYDRGWTDGDRKKAYARLKELSKDPVWIKKRSDSMVEKIKNNGGKNWISFEGLKHSEKTKKIISEKNSFHQAGEKNSQYGTCWINMDNINKKIKITELDLYISEGWERGRKMKEDFSKKMKIQSKKSWDIRRSISKHK